MATLQTNQYQPSTMPLQGIRPSSGLALYGGICGWVLARAHARSGDSAIIAGYLGTDESFDEAITDFARAYADQTEHDYGELVKVHREGDPKTS